MRGQVWVETVVYTLIALTIMGGVLMVVKPKLEELQDKSILEKSIEMMEGINSKVQEVVQGGPGNKRDPQINLRAGEIIIDGVNEKVIFKGDSRIEFSETGKDVEYGFLIVRTEGNSREKTVTLTLNYSDYDIRYDNANVEEIFKKSGTPYIMTIENKGRDTTTNKLILNFKVD